MYQVGWDPHNIILIGGDSFSPFLFSHTTALELVGSFLWFFGGLLIGRPSVQYCRTSGRSRGRGCPQVSTYPEGRPSVQIEAESPAMSATAGLHAPTIPPTESLMRLWEISGLTAAVSIPSTKDEETYPRKAFLKTSSTRLPRTPTLTPLRRYHHRPKSLHNRH